MQTRMCVHEHGRELRQHVAFVGPHTLLVMDWVWLSDALF